MSLVEGELGGDLLFINNMRIERHRKMVYVCQCGRAVVSMGVPALVISCPAYVQVLYTPVCVCVGGRLFVTGFTQKDLYYGAFLDVHCHTFSLLLLFVCYCCLFVIVFHII